jgi:drug/metabolite transporter (DMT)-like permease
VRSAQTSSAESGPVLVAEGISTFFDGIFHLDYRGIDAACDNVSWHSRAHKIESGFTGAFSLLAPLVLAVRIQAESHVARLFIGVGQFGVLFVAMNTGLPAGLASVIAPLQPVFTIPLAVVALGERPSLRQVAGVSLALAGLGTIAAGRAHGVPLQAVALGVASAVVVVSTFFGYGTWYWLLSRHAASTVAPFTLLVPVVGIFTAWLVRGEHPTWGELVGSLIVLVGLALALGLADALAVQRRAAAHAVPPSSCQFASNPSLLARCVREDRSGRAKRGRRRR